MNPSDIWDQTVEILAAASLRTQLADKVAAIRIDLCGEECGHCEHWMRTSDCPRENGSVLTGSPTMKSRACPKFTIDFMTTRIKNQRCAEAIEFATKHNLALPKFLTDWQAQNI